MPYEEHRDLPNAPRGATIWRYMNVFQLLSMLEQRSLYFCRVDRFDDPFEGIVPEATEEAYREMFEEDTEDVPEEAIDNWARRTREPRNMRKFLYVNCWHINDYESAAMWDTYSEDSIAIRTTVDNMIESFDPHTENSIFVSPVVYLDPQEQGISIGNGMYRALWKRKSFEHEKELRAIIHRFPTIEVDKEDLEDDSLYSDDRETVEILPTGYQQEKFDVELDPGISVDIDVEKLIEQIYFHPNSEDWKINAVKSILSNYNFSADIVTQSLLYDDQIT